ncbi:PAS domain-containing protein [Thalassomonas viridans]|uniref:histidine kinase n=1 Tax=Thalassomonas viridans TaxID=137584 RepID=A0AAE9Z6H7_9GAMM|nr:ATP-binding protein [Thalassomonas viridans]WDE06173.1 PAS domain-containing protein [Thalassomonas viridans]
MGFNKFPFLVVTRTLLVVATLMLLTLAIISEGYHATSLLLFTLLVAQVVEMIRFVSKTNAELVRFLAAARNADFSQRFHLSKLGSGFDDLGEAFAEILERLQQVRTGQEEELRHIKAVVEHVPVPLISIRENEQLTLWNNSARRLFGAHAMTRVKDLARFDSEFPDILSAMSAGEQRLVNLNIDGMEHRLSIVASEIVTGGQREILLSMQDIQSELDSAQLQAWQELVRVLTHEIMNSITPVASLAKTAVDLTGDVKAKVQELVEERAEERAEEGAEEIVEEVDDVLSAVQTVARRSEGLMHFVSSYRKLTRLPEPKKKHIRLSALFEQVQLLATREWAEKGIRLNLDIMPAELDLSLDVDMAEQMLINLLQNAEQALGGIDNPQVKLSAFLNARGHVVIEVSDNGSGISGDINSKVFVPFFTTKKEGSGVGLALTRQIMIAHGGHVALAANEDGGATFSLTF